MGPFGVGRVVEEAHDPSGPGGLQVRLEPAGHRAGGGAVEVVRVERDEVHPTVVERVIGLVAGREAARFGFGRADVAIVEWAGSSFAAGGLALVVAHRCPAGDVAQGGLVH